MNIAAENARFSRFRTNANVVSAVLYRVNFNTRNTLNTRTNLRSTAKMACR